MIRRIAGIAAALFVVAGCSTATARIPAPRSATAKPATVAVGFSASTPKAVASVAAKAGVRPKFVSTYVNAGSTFPSAWAALASKDGATLVIQIDTGSIPLSQVAAGADDDWLQSFARTAAAWHGSLAIGIDHEFNGPWWPWSYNHQSATSFVAAWRHIVTVFRRENVNASWVWRITNLVGPQGSGLTPYWPGSLYVTWIGIDGYYYRSSDTFTSVFTPALAESRALADKPVLITETGANPASGRVRAINDLFKGAASTPKFVGLIWFDYDKYSGHDWSIDNDPAALVAFRAAAQEYGEGNADRPAPPS